MIDCIPPASREATKPSALGINAKSASTRTDASLQTQLQKVARYSKQAEARRILNWKRLNECMRAPLGVVVQVNQALANGSCSYSGLSTCGSVWVCPVCAAKVSERRREELNQAIAIHRHHHGGSVLFLTLTFSHQLHDDLGVMLERFAKALKYFWSGRQGMALKGMLGLKGSIRALEVTHGQNGWHPHAHYLLFIRRSEEDLAIDQADDPELMLNYKRRLFDQWESACRKAGLALPSLERGVDLRDGSYAADYASKWGMASELTKAHMKTGRGASRTPWDLLDCSLVNDDRQAAALFSEYAHAFKGKRQLYWTKGLRESLDLDEEMTDEEIAAARKENTLVLGYLEREEWKLILKHDARAHVLIVAEGGGWEAVQAFLRSLKPTPE